MDITEPMIFDEDALQGFYSGYDNDNSSDDSSSSSETGREFICDDAKTGLQLFHAVFQPLAYGLVTLLGAAGNGLMLTVLLRRRRSLRITEIYLLHLAVADLLLLSTLPLSAAEGVFGWPFGDVLCKAAGLLERLNLLCGSLLLACIGFDRYLAVVHAVPSLQSRRRPRTVHLTCASLWLVCLALSAPGAFFYSVAAVPTNPLVLSCAFNQHGTHANNWMLADRFLTHAFGFAVPVAVMGYCYTAIVLTLCRSGSSTQRSMEKQGAIRLALVVTAVFYVCWLPYNVAMLMDTMVVLGVASSSSCESHARLEQALVVTESLGLSHCCLNPFLYAFAGVRFRRDLLQLFSGCGCSPACLTRLVAQGRGHAPATSSGPATTTSILI